MKGPFKNVACYDRYHISFFIVSSTHKPYSSVMPLRKFLGQTWVVWQAFHHLVKLPSLQETCHICDRMVAHLNSYPLVPPLLMACKWIKSCYHGNIQKWTFFCHLQYKRESSCHCNKPKQASSSITFLKAFYTESSYHGNTPKQASSSITFI